MIRKILSFVFLFNLIIADLTGNKNCNEYFEEVKSLLCLNLAANDNTETCSYSNNKCTSVHIYSSCEDYRVADGQTIDSKTCSSINLPVGKETKMCEVNTQTNKCVEVDRKCKDYVVGGAACSNLQAGDNKKRCLLFNNKCEAHYKSCEDVPNQSECSTNLPLKSQYSSYKYSKCFWDQSCKPTKRKCSEYKNYKVYLESLETDFLYCSDLQPDSDSDNICILDNKGNCLSALGDCEDYNEHDENVCKKYKPIDSNQLRTNYKCALDTNGDCKQTLKECSEYKEGEDVCTSLDTKDNTKTHCVLDNNNKCVEKYRTCASYNAVITDKTKRKPAECTAIVPEDVESINSPSNILPANIKCIFEDDQCKEQKKECKDYKSKVSCEGHSYALNSYPSKRCVFKNNECKEQYSSCEDYEKSGETKKKDVCESILEDSLTDKCVFTDNGNNVVTCRTKTRSCNEFSLGKLQNLCTEYNQLYSLKHNEKCVYNNGVCKQTSRNCVDILIDTSLTTENKEKLCNSGITGKNKICTLNEDKNKCIEKDNPNCEKCQSQNSNNNNSDNNDDQNSGKEIYLNKLLIFILSLLL